MRIVGAIFFVLTCSLNGVAQTYRVGAKHFNESYILGEILSQLIEQEGYKVERKFNLGGTAVCYEALRTQSIDLYPEYTGSLAEEILKSNIKLSHEELNSQLKSELGLEISSSFGFNNTYAIATTPQLAEELSLKTISDLQTVDNMEVALSYEFLKRNDGWDNLKAAYQLKINPVGIEHGLAYQAIVSGKIQLTDVYSTDGEIEKYDLFLLEDDRNFFPNYNAVAVFNVELNNEIKKVTERMAGMIS
ncbi:MAG: glycine betaine ABC transporter substrate-binding protein, partial [Cyclobacteriaceae bacterium]